MAKQNHMRVKAECTDCGGTGLYSGMCEPSGVAVVCIRCKGTGCEIIHYVPFVKRKPKKEISTVRCSRGSFIASGVGPYGGVVSYEEFCKGKMPS